MIILGTNSIKDTGYDVANSLRFNAGSSDHLSKTYSSAGNRDTFTFSTWVKRGILGTEQRIFSSANTSGTNAYGALQFHPTYDDLIMFHYDGSSNYSYHRTNRQFKDPSAWLHICIAVDTTQSTASNRVKIYINGSQETSFRTETTPNQNTDMQWNTAEKHWVGAGDNDSGGQSRFLDGYLAETVFIDGLQLAPTSFGEFDEDSGIWKPIDVSGLTFGDNGFYLDFEDSSALGNDAAGSNNFTSNNFTAIDQSTDTCTNNFCTINVLDNESGNITITEGNLNYTSTGGTDETNRCTFGFTKGKWYFESKYINDANYIDVGVGSASDSDIATPRFHMEMAGYYMLQSFTSYTKVWDNGSLIATLAASAENDIHMYAIDMDNNRFYAGKNGSWYSSGDPANNSNPLISMDNGYTTLMPSVCTKSDAAASLNFGSPSYSISSGNTDADGHGNFEYAVPSGFFSLCTKNLAEYG